eukprot:TRINITY_DN35951_c0_g1_i1.p1 TRINITY_DN35951_c0_g1~~TRINITY_DN35951_c0_g1_i1.p1  ORF type:complete len:222 (-),score=89.04 TRINITY_DN35951_c0_g1_i1:91-756(-)
MEVIQEGKFIKATKQRRGVKWTPDLTEKFFDCLRKYGLDFSVMEHLFPGFRRRDILLKYRREERKDPDKITFLLMNPLPPDQSEFTAALEQAEAQKKEKQKKEQEMLKSLGISEVALAKLQKTSSEDVDVTIVGEQGVVVVDGDTKPLLILDDSVQSKAESEKIEEADIIHDEEPSSKKSALDVNYEDDDEDEDDDDVPSNPLDALRREQMNLDEYEDSIY